MRVRVIDPPEPFLTPADIPGSSSENWGRVEALIAAVTEELDGPQGWLGRCLGAQVLEVVSDSWGTRSFALPCPPVSEIVSVVYIDRAGAEQTILQANYARTGEQLWLRPTYAAPALGAVPEPIRIRYRAGYSGSFENNGTGPVPARVKQAIVLSVQHMLSVGAENLFLRSIEVPDVVTKTFTVSDQAAELVKKTVERLVGGLRVYSL